MPRPWAGHRRRGAIVVWRLGARPGALPALLGTAARLRLLLDLGFGLVVGLGFGLLVGLGFGLVVVGLGFGLVVGLGFGLVVGLGLRLFVVVVGRGPVVVRPRRVRLAALLGPGV